MSQRLSVIITCFNQGRFIASNIRALLDDLRAEDEIIISDDGSTDGSLEKIIDAHESDPRVRILRHAATCSVSRTRNRGLVAASGDWISFLDGDDEYLSGRRAALATGIEQHSNVDVLFTDYFLWSPESGSSGLVQALANRGLSERLEQLADPTSDTDWMLLDSAEVTLLALQEGSPLHISSSMFRRQWLQAQGIVFDSKLKVAEDTDFTIRALQGANVAYLRVPTSRYRVSESGLASRVDLEAGLSRVLQRLSNLQLPLTGPGKRGERPAWKQVASAETDFAFYCRTLGHSRLALRYALRSYVAEPRMVAIKEIVKAALSIMIGKA